MAKPVRVLRVSKGVGAEGPADAITARPLESKAGERRAGIVVVAWSCGDGCRCAFRGGRGMNSGAFFSKGV